MTGIENARGPADGPGGGPRIVVLGDVMVDVVAHLDGPVAPGSDAPARIAFRGGGSAANCAVAETENDMRALIVGALAPDEAPASFLLPTRQADLFRWCLREGLRVVKPMTYMSMGEYREPDGRWVPSVLYWGRRRPTGSARCGAYAPPAALEGHHTRSPSSSMKAQSPARHATRHSRRRAPQSAARCWFRLGAVLRPPLGHRRCRYSMQRDSGPAD